MTIDTDNTADTGTPPAVLVENLTFRYRSLDDEPETKHYKTPPAEPPLEQPQAIEDISFSLPAGELIPAAGSDLINGLILLPILLVAYNAAVRRFGRA